MKTLLLCFAFFLLFVLSGAQAKNSIERVDPQAESLQLVIDIDETVRIEIASSDKTTSSVSINTDIDEVVLQRDQTTYTVKKVITKNTPATNKKPNNTPITTPKNKNKHNSNNDNKSDESRAFAASSSSFAICLSVLAIGCQLVFGEKLFSIGGHGRSIGVCTLLMIFFVFFVSEASVTSATSKSTVTVRVFLPDDIRVSISQKSGRVGIIDVEGDHSLPIRIKSLRFETTTNTELKNLALESCDTISIVSRGNILVEDFLAPSNQGTPCSIFFQSDKQVTASLSDGYLGSFSLYCKQSSPSSTQSCIAQAKGSAVKHINDPGVMASMDIGTTFNATTGNTLCDGVTGYNTLTATGSKINIDFGSSPDCVPVVGTPNTLPSTSEVPEAPSTSSKPVAPSSSLPASSPASSSAVSPAPASASPSSLVASSCRTVNGIQWCFNPTACGESCETVCSFFGFSISIDDTTWFEAQNELSECQAIATAFGIGSVNLDSWSYGCLEDFPDVHGDPSKLIGPLYCSTESACPALHRTATDQLGSSCAVQSRKSICPCQ